MPHITESFPIEQDRENEEVGYVTPILKTMVVDLQYHAHNHKSGTKIRIQTK